MNKISKYDNLENLNIIGQHYVHGNIDAATLAKHVKQEYSFLYDDFDNLSLVDRQYLFVYTIFSSLYNLECVLDYTKILWKINQEFPSGYKDLTKSDINIIGELKKREEFAKSNKVIKQNYIKKLDRVKYVRYNGQNITVVDVSERVVLKTNGQFKDSQSAALFIQNILNANKNVEYELVIEQLPNLLNSEEFKIEKLSRRNNLSKIGNSSEKKAVTLVKWGVIVIIFAIILLLFIGIGMAAIAIIIGSLLVGLGIRKLPDYEKLAMKIIWVGPLTLGIMPLYRGFKYMKQYKIKEKSGLI